MLSIINRMIKISGKDKNKIIWSILFSLLENTMIFTPYILLYYGILNYVNGTLTIVVVKNIGIVMLVSVIAMVILRRVIDELLSARGISIFARQRIKFLSHLSKLPMGYFGEKNLGNITSILTTDLLFAEQYAMVFIGDIVTAYISIFMIGIFFTYFNLYIGMTYIVIVLLGFLIIRILSKITAGHSSIRQQQLSDLSESVVEYVRGMQTIKAFNISSSKSSDFNKRFMDSRDKAVTGELSYIKGKLVNETTVNVGAGIIIFLTLILYNFNLLSIDKTLAFLIFGSVSMISFLVLEAGIPRMRILEASLDKFDKVMNEEELIDGKNTQFKINNYDIEFKDVSFAYSEKQILKNINFNIKENTLNALVGKSGSGKTTITNLISRFWDVNEGTIKIGGVNIKDIPLEKIMDNISIVFQNVYLFKDTIFNNIAFGEDNPNKEAVILAAKKSPLS